MRQPIDSKALSAYIAGNFPQLELPLRLKQFSHGQSNPTYELSSCNGEKYVLRKKPPGLLLSQTAHRVEREYQILKALEHTDVPVPKVYCFCDDSTIIGSPFYIMEFLDGRIFEDPWLPNIDARDRNAIWHEAIDTLAKLHSVDISQVGLDSWKRQASYYHRQLKSLSSVSMAQAKAGRERSSRRVGHLPYFHDLLRFFSKREFQPEERRSLVHGDFKLDNLVFHKTEPRVIGILDWEMATEGHPLADLANLVSPFLWSAENIPLLTELSLTEELRELQSNCCPGNLPGLPTLEDCQAWYHRLASWDPSEGLEWAAAFNNFRTAVIMQGIASRMEMGQASGVEAKQFAMQTLPYAMWAHARSENIEWRSKKPSPRM